MTSSSVIGTAVAFHLFDSPRPINSRRHNNNNLLFFTPSASTSSSRFNRHAETSHHHHRHVNSRWIHSGVFLQSGSFKQASLRKRYVSSAYQISEFSAAVRQRQVLCFRANNRRGSYLDTCLPGFFNDKSKFCLSKKALSLDHGFKVKAVGIPRASMGTVEPHAASTASASDFLLEEGLESNLEKIGLDLFLRSELPSYPKLYRG